MNWPPSQQRARLDVREEGGGHEVEPDQWVVVEQQRVGLHGARLRVRAGDRLRMDLVAEVGAGGLAPGDQRVGEGLKRAVGERRGGGGRRGGREDALRNGQRGEHEPADRRARTPAAGPLGVRGRPLSQYRGGCR